MDANETNKEDQSALHEMVKKLDNRVGGAGGYMACMTEVQAILGELSPLASAAISETTRNPSGKIISVDIKIGFSLDRSLL